MRIEIVGLELYGHHGVLEEERRRGQRFLYDLDLELADAEAPRSDRIEDAQDYRRVVAIVRRVAEGNAYHLLEALAADLADALLAELDVVSVRVRVRKPEVDLGGPVEHAAVVVERAR